MQVFDECGLSQWVVFGEGYCVFGDLLLVQFKVLIEYVCDFEIDWLVGCGEIFQCVWCKGDILFVEVVWFVFVEVVFFDVVWDVIVSIKDCVFQCELMCCSEKDGMFGVLFGVCYVGVKVNFVQLFEVYFIVQVFVQIFSGVVVCNVEEYCVVLKIVVVVLEEYQGVIIC